MPLSQNGKAKSSRVSIHYYSRVATRRCVYALGFGVAWFIIWAAYRAGRADALASPGQVHSGHAGFETDCTACHAGWLHPTGSESVLHRWVGEGAHASDQLCQRCHAAPQHHAAAKPDSIPSCAACHRDHQGRNAPLALVSDAACIACHKDLPTHSVNPLLRVTPSITAFTTDHTGFHVPVRNESENRLTGAKQPGLKWRPKERKPLAQAAKMDPGNLVFNHQLHLKVGLTRGNQSWSLMCESCHKLDPAGEGGFYKPVTYAHNCQECHPLTWPFEGGAEQLTIPHGLQPPDVRAFLRGSLVGDGLKHPPPPREVVAPTLPGQPLPGGAKRPPQSIDQLIFEGQAKCGLCHTYARAQDTGMVMAVKPSGVPQIWFEHAAFSHRPHRVIRCEECHNGIHDSAASADIVLPDLVDCRKCHGAVSTAPGAGAGGPRATCVTCHTYHDGDNRPNTLEGRLLWHKKRIMIDDLFKNRLTSTKGGG